MERGGAKGRRRKRGRQRLKGKAADDNTNLPPLAHKPLPSRVAGMATLPVVLLLCTFHVFTAGAQTESTEAPGSLPSDCREEMYPCTRMYSVHRPAKKCIGGFCLYSLSRMYVINNEICTRTVCAQDEYMKAELCRERSGWPRRIQRSANQRRRCRSRRGNPNTWENKV